jgi:hypothetical protein
MGFDLLGLLGAKDRSPAECVIQVDHVEIASLYPFLIEASVQTSRTEAATATLSFEMRRDELGEWLVQDEYDAGHTDPVLAEWKPVCILAAFGTRSEEVFRGYIRQVKAEYPEDAGAARLTVECQDESILLDRVTPQKIWGSVDNPVSDRTILAEMLSSYGGQLAPSPDCGNGQMMLFNLNQNDSDIVFLKARAQASGYELIFREGLVYFGPMRLSGQPQDTVMVYAGTQSNCLSLSISTDGHQPDRIAYNVPANGSTEAISGDVGPTPSVLGPVQASSANRGLPDYVRTLTGQAGTNASAIQAVAQQQVDDAAMHKIQGEGELDGALYGHVLQSGATVPVDGLGSRYSGVYYVDTVTHTFNTNGYRQRFKLLRDAWGDNLDGVQQLGARIAACF